MITLSSDFGGYYPAIMKGVIRDRTEVELLDVSHEFPRHNVQVAAFWLREILPWFPECVHLVVIDPGVGSDRRAIVIRSGGHAFVGPDNGVLVPVARRLGGEEGFERFEITITDPESATFHGRDVFAPIAADVHDLGIDSIERHDQITPIESVIDLQFPEYEEIRDGAIGEVLGIDSFGNVITNIPGDIVRAAVGATIEVNATLVPVGRSYAAVDVGEKVVTVGSHGNVELAVNQGRGDTAFDVTLRSSVTLRVQ